MTDIPAGPELDRLVAEKVMGIPATCIGGEGDCSIWHSAGPNTDFGDWREFSPSANIAHAWGVVERMAAQGKALQVAPYFGGRYHCSRAQDGDWDCCDWYAIADTAPLAICRAALKAVGHRKDGEQ